MDWLYEGRTSVYAALLLSVAVLAGMWWRDRKAGWLWAALPFLGLALLHLLLDWAVETKQEHIARKLREMAAAVQAKDHAAILRHLSPRFAYGRMTRDDFAQRLGPWLKDGWIDGLAIWDIRPEKDEVRLLAKPKGGVAVGVTFLVRTSWTLDDDNQWRLSGFAVYNQFIDTDKPLDVPNLPR